MKITLFIAFVFLSFVGHCQKELGQNKKFIVEKNFDCIVDFDADDIMIFNCDGVTKFYMLNSYGLCRMVGAEFPKSFHDESIEMLLDENFKIIHRGIVPIKLSLKNGKYIQGSPAVIYANDEMIVTILEQDLIGSDSSDFFGVYFEKQGDTQR